MKLTIVPLEERILLDAAAASTIASGYEADHASAEKAHQEQAQQQAASQNEGHHADSNAEAVSGRILVISSQVEQSALLKDAAHQDGQTTIVYDFNTSLEGLLTKFQMHCMVKRQLALVLH